MGRTGEDVWGLGEYLLREGWIPAVQRGPRLADVITEVLLLLLLLLFCFVLCFSDFKTNVGVGDLAQW